jgi:hypothetical protein
VSARGLPKPLVAAAAALAALCVHNHAQAAPWAAGANVTLQGEIIIPPVIEGNEWFWPGSFAREPCEVMTLRGKGALPPECVVGKRMTLKGRVIEDGVRILDVNEIRCF